MARVNKKLLLTALFSISAGAVISCGGGGGGTPTQTTTPQTNQTQETTNPNNPRFAEPKEGWNDNKVVGPYEVNEINGIRLNNIPLAFNNASSNLPNENTLMLIGDILYGIDNGPNGNRARVVAINTRTNEPVSVTLQTPDFNGLFSLNTFTSGNNLNGITVGPIIYKDEAHNFALVLGNGNGANNGLYFLHFEGTTVRALPVIDTRTNTLVAVNAATGFPLQNSIIEVRNTVVNNNHIYLGISITNVGNFNVTRAYMLKYTGGNFVAAFRVPQDSAFPYAFKWFDDVSLWEVFNNGNLTLAYYRFDFTRDNWMDIIADNSNTTIINTGDPTGPIQNALLDQIDFDKDGNYDTLNATDITNIIIREVGKDAKGKDYVEFYLTAVNATLDNTNDNDTVVGIARAIVSEGNKLNLDNWATIAYLDDPTTNDNLTFVREIPVTENSWFVAITNSTDNLNRPNGNETVVGYAYIERQFDGSVSYKVVNFHKGYLQADREFGTFNNTLPINPDRSYFNATELFNSTLTEVIGVPDKKYGIIAGFKENGNASAQVLWVGETIQLSRDLRDVMGGIGIGNVTSIRTSQNLNRVFVADDINRVIHFVKWDEAGGWQVEQSIPYGQDPENDSTLTNIVSLRNIPQSGLLRIDNDKVVAILSNATGAQKYWLFQYGTGRSTLGIPQNIGVYYDTVDTQPNGGLVIAHNGFGELAVYYANADQFEQWGNVRLYFNLDNVGARAVAGIGGALVRNDRLYLITNSTNATTNFISDYAQISLEDKTDAVVVGSALSGESIRLVRFSGSGKVVYAVDNNSNIYIVDVSDPSDPKLVNTVSPGFGIVDATIANDGSAVYIVGSNVLAKVSKDKGLEKTVDLYMTFGNDTRVTPTVERVAYAGNYVIVGVKVNYNTSGQAGAFQPTSSVFIRVYNANDLTPVSGWVKVASDIIAGDAQPRADVIDLDVYDNKVYVHYITRNHQDNTIELIDISDPANPKVMGPVEGVGNSLDLSLSKKFAYLQDNNIWTLVAKFSINDGTLSGNPLRVNLCNVGDCANTFIWQTAFDQYALLADSGDNRIELYNMFNPEQPVYAGDVVLPFAAWNINNFTTPVYATTQITYAAADIDQMDGKTYLVVGTTNDGIRIVDLNPETKQSLR